MRRSRPSRPSLRFLLLSVLLAVPPAAAAAPCRSDVVDSLSIHSAGGHPVVTVSVNGEPVSMLLDTGADTTVVTPALAARLGLRVQAAAGDVATGLGGGAGVPVATATARVGLTGRPARQRILVLDLPGATGPIAGLAGVDILSGFDLDLDLPGGQVLLRRTASSCTDRDAPPWPGLPAERLPVRITPRNRVLVPVTLGALEVQAVLDTGVDGPILARDAAMRAGITDAEWRRGAPASFMGVGLRPVPIRMVRVPALAVGGEHLGAQDVAVPEVGPPGVEMLLGSDYLMTRRVLISWSRRALWVRPAASGRTGW